MCDRPIAVTLAFVVGWAIACTSRESEEGRDRRVFAVDGGPTADGAVGDALPVDRGDPLADALVSVDGGTLSDASVTVDGSVVLDGSLVLDGSVADAAPRDAAVPLPRPNIVFILSDDQRATSIDCMPKLTDLLTRRGVKFTNNFASTPLCCPGRSSVLTGKYAHNHGVRTNGDIEEGDTESTPGVIDFMANGNEELIFAKWLRQVGYRTGFYGKYLNGYSDLVNSITRRNHVPPHWDEWHAFTQPGFFDFQLLEKNRASTRPRRVCYRRAPGTTNAPASCTYLADSTVNNGEENYSTDLLTEKAIRFVRDAAQDRVPFFLYFAPYAPHLPALSPARYQPDPNVVAFSPAATARLSNCPQFAWTTRPPSFLEADVSDKPEWVVRQVDKWDRTELNDRRKLQLASVLATEDALERLVQTLEDANIADNTIFVYSADNGYAWGEHWWAKKNCAYEECAKVPLVIFDPRHPRPGSVVGAMTLNIDLAPTFASWGQVTPFAPTTLNGRSLAALVNTATATALRSEILIECWGMPQAAHTHAAVRSERYKYVEYYADTARTQVRVRTSDGRLELELYDLVRDPYELDNIAHAGAAGWAQRGYAAGEIEGVLRDMQARLARLKTE